MIEERWEEECMDCWNKKYPYRSPDGYTDFLDGYLQACRKRQEEIERLKDACRMALRFGTFHQINEELEAKKFIEEVLKAK